MIIWTQNKLNAYNAKIIETPSTQEVWIYDAPVLYRAEREKASEIESKRKTFDAMSARKQGDSLKRK